MSMKSLAGLHRLCLVVCPSLLKRFHMDEWCCGVGLGEISKEIAHPPALG